MTDNVDHLLLEPLKAIRNDMSEIRADIREVKMRLGQLEIGVAGVRREIAHAEEGDAISGVRIDRLQERLERVERRLEIS